MVKTLPANAGDTGLIPGTGTKIPHARGKLSVVPQLLKPTRARTHAPQQEKPPR